MRIRVVEKREFHNVSLNRKRGLNVLQRRVSEVEDRPTELQGDESLEEKVSGKEDGKPILSTVKFIQLSLSGYFAGSLGLFAKVRPSTNFFSGSAPALTLDR